MVSSRFLESIEGQPPALRLLFYYRNTLTISLTQALEINVPQKGFFGLSGFEWPQPPTLGLLFYYRNTLTISLTQALEINVPQKGFFDTSGFELPQPPDLWLLFYYRSTLPIRWPRPSKSTSSEGLFWYKWFRVTSTTGFAAYFSCWNTLPIRWPRPSKSTILRRAFLI